MLYGKIGRRERRKAQCPKYLPHATLVKLSNTMTSKEIDSPCEIVDRRVKDGVIHRPICHRQNVLKCVTIA